MDCSKLSSAIRDNFDNLICSRYRAPRRPEMIGCATDTLAIGIGLYFIANCDCAASDNAKPTAASIVTGVEANRLAFGKNAVNALTRRAKDNLVAAVPAAKILFLARQINTAGSAIGKQAVLLLCRHFLYSLVCAGLPLDFP
jgi:hypothetical protein